MNFCNNHPFFSGGCGVILVCGWCVESNPFASYHLTNSQFIECIRKPVFLGFYPGIVNPQKSHGKVNFAYHGWYGPDLSGENSKPW